jgi:peptidoglycan-associated lipoprotein
MRGSVRVFVSILLVAMVSVSACGKKKPATAPAPAPAPAPPTTPAPPAEKPLSEEEIFARKSLADLNAEKPLGDAFFDLDSSQIRDDARPALQKDADWLKRWTSTKIMVEGHCDSRGTSEYNLALGERRALAARTYLVSLGVPSERLRTVSYGKEFPFDPNHSEGAWAKNRRAHFVVTAK